MRQNESNAVIVALKQIGLKHLKHVNASQTFYNATTLIEGKESAALKDIHNPEVKRKIIGDTFVRVSEQVCLSVSSAATD
jgi:GMP synthase (glutamine-hydrolysing)